MRSAEKLSWCKRALLLALAVILLTGCSPGSQVILIEAPGCTKCAAAQRVLDEVLPQYPDARLVHYTYYTDEGHQVILDYNVKDVPSVIVGQTVIGYKSYDGDGDKLKAMLTAALENRSPEATPDQPADEAPLDSQALKDIQPSSMATVFLAGLLAGFNPCLLAILAFLSSTVITSSGRSRDIIPLVICFSLGIFVVYYLFGVGLFRIFQDWQSMASSIRLFLSLLLVFLGLTQIEDARRLYGGGRSLFKTDWALKYFQGGVSGRRLSTYFLMGALFSLVKAPCVGAVYLAIIGIISSDGYSSAALLYLMLYNLGIILPVLVLGGVMAMGMSPESIDRFRHDHRVSIRVATGLTLIVLAPLIYWQLI
ncbi:MAG: cytochrome c biogenesis protein [Methanosarcinales archaeon]|nr:cytochrome c biogenesis protein [Methanosarcinales archaeon]